ncbi:MAG: GHKL domain-containing protein [Defluviitaleaceae bacterium]|nr:GHKL domain-containing protein [Defluviitaleaceae bacterium]
MALFIPLALLMEAVTMYVIFVNVCRLAFKKIEAVIIISAMAISIFVIIASISKLPLPAAMSLASVTANAFCTIIMILAAHKKTKIFSVSIFYAIFTNIITIFSASLSSAVYDFVFNRLYDYFERVLVQYDWIFYIPYIITMLVFAFIVSRFVGKMYHAKVAELDNSTKKSIGAFLAVSSGITLLPIWAFAFFWEYIFIEPISPIINAISFSIFFALLGFALIAFTNNVRKEADLRIKEESLKNMQVYTRNIENMAAETRNFRHDHSNFILCFKGYVAEEDWEGLRIFLEQYSAKFKEETAGMAIRRLDTLINVITPALKGLYTAKIQYAQQLQIDVHINVPHKIDEIAKENLVDLCRIVGIFLDNAIEACMDTPGAKLGLGIACVSQDVIFIFENTCDEPPTELKKVFERGYSTKGDGRGAGLHIVSQILKKNKNFTLKTTIEDKKFVQVLTIKT